MTEGNQPPEKSKIVPNTFQTPNILADEYMRYLDGDEVKCYLVIDRKTFGWLKRSDRIAKSQIVELTGLSDGRVDDCMKTLVSFGLVLRVAENDARLNYGIEWALQTDDAQINTQAMIERANARNAKFSEWGNKVRAKKVGISQRGGSLTKRGGGSLSKTPQKPLSKDKEEEAKQKNIFQLHEENIGAVYPLIVDDMKEAEKEYPYNWIELAFKRAVENNHRNWKYVSTVLQNMKLYGMDWTPSKPSGKNKPPVSENEYKDALRRAGYTA